MFFDLFILIDFSAVSATNKVSEKEILCVLLLFVLDMIYFDYADFIYKPLPSLLFKVLFHINIMSIFFQSQNSLK